MTAHAERVGVLALLGVLMLVGWCAVALGVSADAGTGTARSVGAVVSKRDGSTTIVVGGPFAAAAIVVPDSPAPTGEAADQLADAAAGDAVIEGLPIVFGSIAIFNSTPVPEPAAPVVAGFDGSAVVVEADRILADSAALEELWRLPAATADQRQPVTKQA
jgi:hypothetical protein